MAAKAEGEVEGLFQSKIEGANQQNVFRRSPGPFLELFVPLNRFKTVFLRYQAVLSGVRMSLHFNVGSEDESLS